MCATLLSSTWHHDIMLTSVLTATWHYDIMLATLLAATERHSIMLAALLAATWHYIMLAALLAATWHYIMLAALLAATWHYIMLAALLAATWHYIMLAALLAAIRRRSGLHSASRDDLVIPATKSKFGERSFAVGGPLTWNALPESIRAEESINIFKWKLKTHLFGLSFDTWRNCKISQSAIVFG